jgi:acyl carrier protein
LSTIIDMLKSEVGEILQVSPDKIDPARSMYDMGLDSLMGVELVVVLEARFGARLPVMALSQNPTIAKLAERIIQQLKGTEETDAASDENELLAQAKLLASQHGAEVSADSIADLAEDLQSRETGSNDKIIH